MKNEESLGPAVCLRASFQTLRSGHEQNGKSLEVWLLGKLLSNPNQSKGVNFLTSGDALQFIYVNRLPMQNVRSENVQKHVIHTVEAKH